MIETLTASWRGKTGRVAAIYRVRSSAKAAGALVTIRVREQHTGADPYLWLQIYAAVNSASLDACARSIGRGLHPLSH